MAITPEGAVKERVKRSICKFAETRGIYVYMFWPVQSGYGAATLDMLGSINGSAFAIETKSPGKKPTARQAICIEEMRAAGMTVFVIDGASGVDELLLWMEAQCSPPTA